MKLYSFVLSMIATLTAADTARSPSETNTNHAIKLDKIPSITTARTTPTLALKKRYTNVINISLGNKKQHVGYLTGQGLYDKVYDCLWNTLCPVTGGTSLRTCKGPTETCTIPGIWYNLREKQYRNSHLDIKIAGYNLDVDRMYRAAPKLLIEQIAGTFKVSSEDAKNCYQPTNGERGKLMCNVGDYVYVSDQLSLAWMNATLRFNGETIEGSFDCAAVKQAALSFLRDKLMDWWKGVLQVGTCNSYIMCASNEVT
ncbi:hypothetical protein K505DRAFT_344227 [Melanomma pulvis-pyrius CBS 109.77]|uniref:Uncharacterized protein n=1 Tax=Melanomma pulvis-pyrius CBS 109.77 TaxID=1314802 RepID=A0A6A6WPV8_9PLEO|nr:hypothetical protein K505DRAFT_344227 [Melanomma pulvis-pyrius CBS 109.77]